MGNICCKSNINSKKAMMDDKLKIALATGALNTDKSLDDNNSFDKLHNTDNEQINQNIKITNFLENTLNNSNSKNNKDNNKEAANKTNEDKENKLGDKILINKNGLDNLNNVLSDKNKQIRITNSKETTKTDIGTLKYYN